MNQGTGKRGNRSLAAVTVLGFLVPQFLLVSGCHSCEGVEAELRTRENEVYALRAQLSHSAAVNQSLHHELQVLKHSSAAKIDTEAAPANDTVAEIVLGWQTGSPSSSRAAGDDALQVVVEPRDAAGRVITAPAGSVHVSVLETIPGGRKTLLCSWDVSAEQLTKSWRKGVLSTGFYLLLPWKNRPTTDKLRIVVDWTTADGRVLEADKDIVLRSALPAKRKPTTEPELPLPPPRKVEDAKPTSWRSPSAPSRPIESTSLRPNPASFPLADTIRLDRPIPLDHFPMTNQP